ncbi:M48 family metallopeptidase [Yoonia sp.]|uniref:M48 family metallopeptidase n=1 Tax=Yoonia sp. TaxID=2212373 RepID=UPI0019EE610D|nr:SprT family zinc-dependent metalloprotease [Yoonia sp.]MBE0412034.1 M48 family metallopeptidase [Yoonia sp.]
MGRHRIEGNPPIEVTLRRSARAKRLSLRVSRLDGRVTLTLPQRLPEREGLAFLHSREDWLRGHLEEMAPAHLVRPGGTVPFEGRDLAVRAAGVRRARLLPDEILVPQGAVAGALVRVLLKAAARDRFAAASDHYATVLGLTYARLSLRDTRSRWGSCTSQGALMYSWRLVMAPPPVLQYVAAHEVAHLVEMNHSAAFWEIVAQLYPDHAACRRWLRENGDRLHRVQFGD